MTSTQVAIQLVTTILTVIGSGVASAVITYRLNRRHDEVDLRREKLEQLCLAVQGFVSHLGAYFNLQGKAANGEITIEQLSEAQIKLGPDDRHCFENAKMLMTIYFPELQDKFEGIIQQREQGGMFIHGFQEKNKTGTANEPAIHDALQGIMAELDHAHDRYLQDLRSVARRLDDAVTKTPFAFCSKKGATS